MEEEFAAVHGPLCRVLLVSRVFGLAPLSFKRRHTVTIVRIWNAQLYYGYLLCSTLIMAVVLGVTILMCSTKRWMEKDRSTVRLVIMFISSGTTSMVVSAAIYGSRKRMKYLLMMLQQLNKITILIPNETTFVKERKRTLTVSIVMLLLVLTFVINCGIITRYYKITINPPQQEIVGVFVYYGALNGQYVIIATLQVQVVLIMHTIRTAVESFNSELKQMIDAVTKDDCRNEVMLFKAKVCLWRIGRYYLTLCENIRRMNSQDGALLLLLVVYLVMQLMEKSYKLVIGLTLEDSNPWNRYLLITLRFYLNVVCVVMMASLVNAFDNVQDEMTKMRVLVSELMYWGRRTGDTFSTAAGMVCEQVLLHQPRFKPLCVCTLSRSLFVSIITGVVTYLVTVLKFYNKEEGFKTEKH